MNLLSNPEVAARFASGSQRVRVLTELWVEDFGYCLRCMSDRLARTAANTPVCDFVCPVCDAPYELKSGAGRVGAKIVDGAFTSMMRRIREGRQPNLLLLRYSSEWHVDSLTALHSVFLTPAIVEKRPPLAATARRAGWVGCNLLLSRVPLDGLIPLVRNGIAAEKAAARELYAQSERLNELKPEQRGWTALVLAVVRRLQKRVFTLAEVYAHEDELHAAYPGNSHVRAKIRQQLQILRNLGYVEFVGNGEYRVQL